MVNTRVIYTIYWTFTKYTHPVYWQATFSCNRPHALPLLGLQSLSYHSVFIHLIWFEFCDKVTLTYFTVTNIPILSIWQATFPKRIIEKIIDSVSWLAQKNDLEAKSRPISEENQDLVGINGASSLASNSTPSQLPPAIGSSGKLDLKDSEEIPSF